LPTSSGSSLGRQHLLDVLSFGSQEELLAEGKEEFFSDCAHLLHLLEHSSEEVKGSLTHGLVVGNLRGRNEPCAVEVQSFEELSDKAVKVLFESGRMAAFGWNERALLVQWSRTEGGFADSLHFGEVKARLGAVSNGIG
jgi:hypothetical protein